MNQTPDALDLEALPLRDIAWVQLHNLLCSQLSSSKLALWPELSLRIRVYEILTMRSSIWRRSEVSMIVSSTRPLQNISVLTFPL